jgi:hypothetical protein
MFEPAQVGRTPSDGGRIVLHASTVRSPVHGAINVILVTDWKNRLISIRLYGQHGTDISLMEIANDQAPPLEILGHVDVSPFAILSAIQSLGENYGRPLHAEFVLGLFRRLRIIVCGQSYIKLLDRALHKLPGFSSELAVESHKLLEKAQSSLRAFDADDDKKFWMLLRAFLIHALSQPRSYTIDGWL